MRDPLPNAAYALPEFIPEDLQVLHAEIVSRLRQESEVIPLFPTIAELLIERIAFNYIVLRYKETGEGMGAGFSNDRNQKEFNSFWLMMTNEFNKMVLKAEDGRASRNAAVEQMLGAFSDALADEDPDFANRIKLKLADSLEASAL